VHGKGHDQTTRGRPVVFFEIRVERIRKPYIGGMHHAKVSVACIDGSLYSREGGDTTGSSGPSLLLDDDGDSQPQDGYVYDFLNSGNLITKVTVDASSTP
jgi:hypothetical protein